MLLSKHLAGSVREHRAPRLTAVDNQPNIRSKDGEIVIASSMSWPDAVVACVVVVCVVGFGAYLLHVFTRSPTPSGPAEDASSYRWDYEYAGTDRVRGDLTAWLTAVRKLLEREPERSWRDASAAEAAVALRDLVASRLEAAGQVT